ncbi:MAG: hypothetical protein EOO61_15890, partial [Hymenobacter sp.]
MSKFNEFIGSQTGPQCPRSYILALTDTVNVIHGKWKLPIIASLLRGVNRFNDLVDIRFSRHNGYGSAKRFW